MILILGPAGDVFAHNQSCKELLESQPIASTQKEIEIQLKSLSAQNLKGESYFDSFFEKCGSACYKSRSIPGVFDLKIQISESYLKPQIEINRNTHDQITSKVLKLPRHIKSQDLANAYLQSLVGHPLHPYTSSNIVTKKFIEKNSQREALQVIKKWRLDGEDRGLIVSSGGTGKTYIYTEYLEWDLFRSKSDRNLNILIANSKQHAQDMYHHILTLVKQHPEVEVLLWNQFAFDKDLDQLLEKAKNEKHPIILVSVVNSFRTEVYRSKLDIPKLKGLTLNIILDESHNVGASQMRSFFEMMDSDTSVQNPFVLGLTATPIHRDISHQAQFHGRSFWTNLDKVDKLEIQDRPTSDILEQLSLSIQAGELTPIDQIYFLSPTLLKIPLEELFVHSIDEDGSPGFRVLNPSAFSRVFGLLNPVYSQNAPSLTFTPTIESSIQIYQYLSNSFPNQNFGLLNSDTKNPNKVLQDFKDGKIKHLIVVKMLDEAFDMPKLQTVVDLSPSNTARQLIQKIARPSRLAEFKTDVHAVFFIGTNKEHLAEELDLLDRLDQGKLKSKYRSEDKQRTIPGMTQFIEVENYREIKKGIIDFWDANTEISKSPGAKSYQEQIIEWIRTYKKSPNGGPKATPEERVLGTAFMKIKAQNQYLWHFDFPPDVIQILKDNVRSLEPEYYLKFSNWIKRHKREPKLMAADPEEKKIAFEFSQFQIVRKTLWYTYLDRETIQIILDSRKIDKARVLSINQKIKQQFLRQKNYQLFFKNLRKWLKRKDKYPKMYDTPEYIYWNGVEHTLACQLQIFRRNNPNWKELLPEDIRQWFNRGVFTSTEDIFGDSED